VIYILGLPFIIKFHTCCQYYMNLRPHSTIVHHIVCFILLPHEPDRYGNG